MYGPQLVRPRVIVGIVLVAVGAIWFGQGVGAIGGSFMSGQAMWAVIGVIAFLFGIAFIRGARRDEE